MTQSRPEPKVIVIPAKEESPQDQEKKKSTAFWMEKSEIIGIDQNAGMAKFFSRRASGFLLYW